MSCAIPDVVQANRNQTLNDQDAFCQAQYSLGCYYPYTNFITFVTDYWYIWGLWLAGAKFLFAIYNIWWTRGYHHAQSQRKSDLESKQIHLAKSAERNWWVRVQGALGVWAPGFASMVYLFGSNTSIGNLAFWRRNRVLLSVFNISLATQAIGLWTVIEALTSVLSSGLPVQNAAAQVKRQSNSLHYIFIALSILVESETVQNNPLVYRQIAMIFFAAVFANIIIVGLWDICVRKDNFFIDIINIALPDVFVIIGAVLMAIPIDAVACGYFHQNDLYDNHQILPFIIMVFCLLSNFIAWSTLVRYVWSSAPIDSKAAGAEAQEMAKLVPATQLVQQPTGTTSLVPGLGSAGESHRHAMKGNGSLYGYS